MSLALLFPLGLAALAAWLLLLALHLVRRERQTPVDFAALRWLAVRAKPRARLRLDERLLLAVRLALVAAMALLLARPALVGGDGAARWEVVHPALAAPGVAGDDGVERRWLADGFPALDTPPPRGPVATASLLRQLDAELPAGAALTVRVPTTLDGLDGERPRLSHTVRWNIVDAAVAAEAPDGVHAPGPDDQPPLALAIRADAAHSADARFLNAVAFAWQTAADTVAKPSSTAPGSAATPATATPSTPAATPATATPSTPAAIPATDTVSSTAAPAMSVDAVDSAPPDAQLPDGEGVVLAWLVSGPVPAAVRDWTARGGTLLLAVDAEWQDADDADDANVARHAVDTSQNTAAAGAVHVSDAAAAPALVDAFAFDDGRVVRLRLPLRPSAWPALLEPTFPETLRGLVAAPAPAPQRADAAAIAPQDGGAAFAAAAREMPAALAWLVVLLFALERWLATGRRLDAGA